MWAKFHLKNYNYGQFWALDYKKKKKKKNSEDFFCLVFQEKYPENHLNHRHIKLKSKMASEVVFRKYIYTQYIPSMYCDVLRCNVILFIFLFTDVHYHSKVWGQ